MKRLTMLCVLLAAFGMRADVGLAGQWEVEQGFDYLLPDDGFWDQAYGGDVKLTYWPRPRVGLALTGGLSQWDAEGDRTTLIFDPMKHERYQTWDGDLQYVPLGVSLLLREYYTSRDLGECEITLEAGCRYLRCNSELELIVEDRTWMNPGQVPPTVTDRYGVECDDIVVGRIGGQLAVPMNVTSKLFVEGGYQFDISGGDISVPSPGQSVSIDLSALYLRAGVAFFLK